MVPQSGLSRLPGSRCCRDRCRSRSRAALDVRKGSTRKRDVRESLENSEVMAEGTSSRTYGSIPYG